MPTLYGVSRRLLKSAVQLYYTDIHVNGASRVPDDGPVIFAANHPNSIMDTVILGTEVDRKIHYLAKSELFENPAVSLFFDRCGVIPLHNSPEDDRGNESAFRSAFELLEEGGCLGIFPEGRNSLERGILKIKTGTARIALGAEAQNDYDLGVRVVPVGLNFENRDQFLSRVLVRVGKPIDARDFGERHRDEPRGAVKELTDTIESSLREVVAVMEGERLRGLAEQVERIYGRRLLDDMVEYRKQRLREAGVEAVEERPVVEKLVGNEERAEPSDDDVSAPTAAAGSFERRLWVQERIADAIEYYQDTAPDLVEYLQRRIQRYLDHLDQLRIHGDLAERAAETGSRARQAIELTAYAVVFSLPALWGAVNNFVPYQLTRLAALQAPDEPMRAFTGLLAAMLLFSLFYAGQGWMVWSFMEASLPLTTVYLLSLPVAGFFSLRYRRQVSKFRNRILVRTLFRTRHNLFDSLLQERGRLVEIFDELRDHFRRVENAEQADEQPPPLPADLAKSRPWPPHEWSSDTDADS